MAPASLLVWSFFIKGYIMKLNNLGGRYEKELFEKYFSDYRILCIVDNNNFDEFSNQMSLVEDNKVGELLHNNKVAEVFDLSGNNILLMF